MFSDVKLSREISKKLTSHLSVHILSMSTWPVAQARVPVIPVEMQQLQSQFEGVYSQSYTGMLSVDAS